jgi:hypothetical protein
MCSTVTAVRPDVTSLALVYVGISVFAIFTFSLHVDGTSISVGYW